jgi:hypothetical protein
MLLAKFFLVSRVSALGMSVAQKFSFSKDPSCMINVESRPSSRIIFGWLEGHGLGSSEGDDGLSVSLESLGEMNGEMYFSFSNGSWLGLRFAMGLLGQEIGVATTVFPNFSLRLHWDVFFEKVFLEGSL